MAVFSFVFCLCFFFFYEKVVIHLDYLSRVVSNCLERSMHLKVFFAQGGGTVAVCLHFKMRRGVQLFKCERAMRQHPAIVDDCSPACFTLSQSSLCVNFIQIKGMPWRVITPSDPHEIFPNENREQSPRKRRKSGGRKKSSRSESEQDAVKIPDQPVQDTQAEGKGSI